jgi:hypothetical protein
MNPSPQVTPSIVARIQALLRLSASPNEHEAALALQRASDLLLKYNLSRAEVEGRGAKAFGVGELRVEIAGRITGWHRILVVQIADHCFCKPVWSRRGFILVGDSENTQAARALFRWLLEQLRWISLGAMLENAGRGKRAARWRFNFCIGAALLISQRLKEARKTQTAANAQAPGLIRCCEQEVERYIRRNIPTQESKRKPIRLRHSTALTLGIIAGNRISLTPQGVLEDGR